VKGELVSRTMRTGGIQQPAGYSWAWLLLLIPLYFVHDYVSYESGTSFTGLIVYALIAVIALVGVINLKLAFLLFTITLVFADDISRHHPSGSYLQSMLTISVGGVAVANILALSLVLLSVLFWALTFSRTVRRPRLSRPDLCILSIGLIYTLATLNGFRWWFINPRGVLNDLNLPIMLLGLYLVARWTLTTRAEVRWFWNLLLTACGAKTAGLLIYFLIGEGFEFGSTLKVSQESGRVILVLVFAWGLVLQDRELPARYQERVLGLFLMTAAGVSLLVQSQRGPWLMTAFAFMVLLFLGRSQHKVRWVTTGAVAVIMTFAAVTYWMPDAFHTIRYHASTLRFWETADFEKSPSTVVRMYEFKNIHAQLADKNDLILGAGPGATFSDKYYEIPFGVSTDEYPWPEIQKRRFQNAHGLLQNLMLNVGYGGMIVYLSLLAVIYWSCFQLVRHVQGYERGIALTLLAFLPAMFYSSWSAKNNMLLGILLGIVGCMWSLEKESDPKIPVTLP
jgi:hypothetical protein